MHLLYNTTRWNVAVKSLRFGSASARTELKLLFLFAACAWTPVVFSPSFTTRNVLRTYAAQLLTFPYSKVLILWAFFWEVSHAKKFWPLRIITGTLLLDKIHSLLTEKKPPTDFIIVLAQSLKTTQASQLSQVFSLKIWELWKSEISDQMVFLITKHSLQVKRAIHQRLLTCLLVIHFSLTEAQLPNGRRKIVRIL